MPFTHRHLLGLEGLPRRGDPLPARHRASPSRRSRSATSRRCRRCAARPWSTCSTRAQHAHAHLVRDRRQAAVAPTTINISVVDLEQRNKGETLLDTARNLAAMRPDAIVVRHPRSGAPHFLAAPRRLPGDQRRRRRARAPDAGAARSAARSASSKGRIDGLDGRDRRRHPAQPRRALEPLRACARSARRCGWSARRRCCRAEFGSFGVERAPRSARRGSRGADVIMMLRIQRERQGANFFPALDEYSRLFCLDRAALAARQARRGDPAPRTDEPRRRDRERRRRRAVLADPRPGHQRRRRAHGGALPARRRAAAREAEPTRRTSRAACVKRRDGAIAIERRDV